MIRGMIRLVFLIVVLVILSQLEYRGRPLKEHLLKIYRTPMVQMAVEWGQGQATTLLGLKNGSLLPVVPEKNLEQISEEDQKGLDTLLKKVDK